MQFSARAQYLNQGTLRTCPPGVTQEDVLKQTDELASKPQNVKYTSPLFLWAYIFLALRILLSFSTYILYHVNPLDINK